MLLLEDENGYDHVESIGYIDKTKNWYNFYATETTTSNSAPSGGYTIKKWVSWLLFLFYTIPLMVEGYVGIDYSTLTRIKSL